jgi:hypothetical protein
MQKLTKTSQPNVIKGREETKRKRGYSGRNLSKRGVWEKALSERGKKAEWNELQNIVRGMRKSDRMVGFQLLAGIHDRKLVAEDRFSALDRLDKLLWKYNRYITISDAMKAMEMMMLEDHL